MSSIAKERPYVPQIDRHMLRYQLFQEIRTRGYYQNDVTAKLRKSWKAAAPEVGPDGWARSFPELHALGRISVRPALATYVAAVQSFTSDTLRITRDGQPVTWAAAFVHVDVEPRSTADGLTVIDLHEPPPTGTSRFGPVFGELKMFVNPDVARFGTNDDLSTWQTVPAAVFMQFDEWDEFERAAVDALKNVIAKMRREYASQYPRQRPSTGPRRATDISRLATHLMTGKLPPSEAERKRLSRVADKIGLDFPRTKTKARID